MKYLIACDHEKLTVEAEGPVEAKALLPCKKCRYFNLKGSKLVMKEIRVYWTNEQIHAKRLPIVRNKTADETMDWVDMLERHSRQVSAT